MRRCPRRWRQGRKHSSSSARWPAGEFVREMPSSFAIEPPIEPMLARTADDLPGGVACLYEPKGDGFRAIVFRPGADLCIQSRDLRALDRYFPELPDALLANV